MIGVPVTSDRAASRARWDVPASAGTTFLFRIINFSWSSSFQRNLLWATVLVGKPGLSTDQRQSKWLGWRSVWGKEYQGPVGGLNGSKGIHIPEDPAMLWSPDFLFTPRKPVLPRYGLRASVSASTCSTPSWTYVDEESDRIVKFMSWATVLVSATKAPELGKLPMLQQ